MDNKLKDSREYYTIDLLHVAKNIWHRAWMILITGIVTAVIGFSISSFAIAPKYSSSIMLYV